MSGSVRPRGLQLVVADTWCEMAALCESVVAEVHDVRTHVVVTTSLRIGRLQSPFTCDTQQLAHAARRRAHVLGWLRSRGIAAVGLVGDPDPLLAVGDVLARFDEAGLERTRILVVTDGPDPRDWREHRLAERLEAAYRVQVTRCFAHQGAAVRP